MEIRCVWLAEDFFRIGTYSAFLKPLRPKLPKDRPKKLVLFSMGYCIM